MKQRSEMLGNLPEIKQQSSKEGRKIQADCAYTLLTIKH